MAVAILSTNNLNFTSNGVTPVATLTATSSGLLTFSESANPVELRGVKLPTVGDSAVNKTYVDSLVGSGIRWKAPVRVVSAVNGTLASAYANGSTVDGVVLATGNRILLAGQTTATENGIYIVAASGAPARSADFAIGDLASGVAAFIEVGTLYADSAWVCTADAPVDVVGTNNLPFVQFSGLGQVVAGTGISKSGNTISVDPLITALLGTAQSFTGVKTFTVTPVLSANLQLTGTTAENGYIEFANTTAPGTTTNKLYVVSGVLTYNGAPVGGISSGVVGKLPYYTGAFTIDDSAISVVNGAGVNDALNLNKVTTTGGSENTAGTVLVSGGNLTLNATIPLNLGTTFTAQQIAGPHVEFKTLAAGGNTLFTSEAPTGFFIFKTATNANDTGFRVTNLAGTHLINILGDQSATVNLNAVWSTGTLTFNDTVPLRLGTGVKVSLVHSGTHATVTNTVGNYTVFNNSGTTNINLQLGNNADTSAFRVANFSDVELLRVGGTGLTTVTNSTASSSSTTGALVVTGGVGIGGDTRCAGVSYALSHNATSDQRLKRDVADISHEDLNKLAHLESKSFFWKEGPATKQFGIIAQQVEDHLPEIIETDNDTFKSVNVMSLVGLLLAKVNDLQKQVNALALRPVAV